MHTRRELLTATLGPIAASLLPASPVLAAAYQLLLAPDERSPEDAAQDEDLWNRVARAFPVDRSLINLDHAAVCPAPAASLDAMARHVATSNLAPAHTMKRVLEPQRESVRQTLARHWGVDAEEIAITRNASEALETLQLGFDLQPGDEVLTTTVDYPRMVRTFRQRERREGIVLRLVELPVPTDDAAEVVRLLEAALTKRTRLLLVCHVISVTGQVLPVAEIVAMARRHGVPTIVDGAHALAHLPFQLPDLGCDFYASSLHKWLFAPIGTGLLYVRRERIGDLWPLMAGREGQDGDIRKFEEIGTHPAAPTLAIAEALTFHQAVGDERKLARLVYLRDRWARTLAEHPRVRLWTSLEPGQAGGIASFAVEGLDPTVLKDWLWDHHQIMVRAVKHPQCPGIRVSPGLATTLGEVDRFVEALAGVLEHGLPG